MICHFEIRTKLGLTHSEAGFPPLKRVYINVMTGMAFVPPMMSDVMKHVGEAYACDISTLTRTSGVFKHLYFLTLWIV